MKPISRPGAALRRHSDPAVALAAESAMLDRVALGHSTCEISIWSTARCLVAPRPFSHLPAFETARCLLEAEGVPLHLRATGGDLAPQGPGIVNLTIAFVQPPGRPLRIEQSYEQLCEPTIAWLRSRNISARCGPLGGTFCDGAYNILIGDRKLAGTAQRWRAGPRVCAAESSLAVLAHVSIHCAGDLHRLSGAADRFYATCGLEQRIRPENHIALFDMPALSGDFVESPDSLDRLARELDAAYADLLRSKSAEEIPGLRRQLCRTADALTHPPE